MTKYPEFEGHGGPTGKPHNTIRHEGVNGDMRGHVKDHTRLRDQAYMGGYLGNPQEHRSGGHGSREIHASGRRAGDGTRRTAADLRLEKAFEKGYIEKEDRLSEGEKHEHLKHHKDSAKAGEKSETHEEEK